MECGVGSAECGVQRRALNLGVMSLRSFWPGFSPDKAGKIRQILQDCAGVVRRVGLAKILREEIREKGSQAMFAAKLRTCGQSFFTANRTQKLRGPRGATSDRADPAMPEVLPGRGFLGARKRTTEHPEYPELLASGKVGRFWGGDVVLVFRSSLSPRSLGFSRISRSFRGGNRTSRAPETGIERGAILTV